MLFLRGLLVFLGVAVVIAVVLFIDFTVRTFAQRPYAGVSDAVVVLTGGKGRVEKGLRLYREGKGKSLLLVGVDPAVRKRDLFRELPGEDITLEKVSRNTMENALYSRDLLVRRDVHTVTLITSRYHMIRAALIFHNVLPKDIVIRRHPVDTENLQEAWWSHSGSFKLLFSEFYKYCMYRFFFILVPGDLRTATQVP